ncbi:hypothetical protein F5ESL0233_05265 [Lactobacillus sp. ESL0233]|uniref:hypothetical protein n=1 Tax=Lactobacillus sp. ESL0233 TaxID=2069354 RepID=UPI000EFA6AEE|nr:hypothetical protein [Lactobacillus sp. ESL0233]RMC41727.1 hypothetical protein F5ESL0233_05265 [Lactobacillus sp. ESL0233]
MVEQALVKNAEELKLKFQIAIKKHHTTQRKVAKYCNTNEFQFSKAISGDPAKRSQEIRKAAAEILGIEI